MHSVPTNNSWIVCILFSCTESGTKMLSRTYNCLIRGKKQFFSTSKTEEWRECPASRKRDSWGKSTKITCWAHSKKLNQFKLVDQSFADRIEQFRAIIFDLELMKSVDYFQIVMAILLVTFQIKPLLANRFLNSKEIWLYQLLVQMK